MSCAVLLGPDRSAADRLEIGVDLIDDAIEGLLVELDEVGLIAIFGSSGSTVREFDTDASL
jgi:hypothetical protein